MSYAFEIRFISPLLMGGHDPRGQDELGLRGSSLRGCWRFWCRALMGSMLPHLRDHSQILDLESQLFGSTGRATFHLQVMPRGLLSQYRARFARLPHKTGGARALRDGFSDGVSFRVFLRPRSEALTTEQQAALLASIWLWGNLGAVGNRSRRGFGSPVLAAITEQNDPFTTLDLPLTQEFNCSTALTHHLRQGIERVWELLEAWITSERNNALSRNRLGDSLNPLEQWLISERNFVVARSNFTDPDFTVSDFEFFQLRSLNQVSVSTRSFADLGCVTSGLSANGAIATIHGDRNARPELGQANPRLASPAFIRLHKVNSQWVPVCTWSRFRHIRDRGRARAYLKSIGFTHSILGTPW